MSLKELKIVAPYLIGLSLILGITFYHINAQLTSPLTNDQMGEIKNKLTAYNLKFISTKDKELFGCGSGNLYRVPVEVENNTGTRFFVSYCPGNWTTPSQIRI